MSFSIEFMVEVIVSTEASFGPWLVSEPVACFTRVVSCWLSYHDSRQEASVC